MSSLVFFIAVFAGLTLTGLLVWALRGAARRSHFDHGMAKLDNAPRHLNNMAQIRQSMDPADFAFVKARGRQDLPARLRRERRQVVLLYLEGIRADFEHSLRVARIIAVLSPEVSGSQEYQRIRLGMVFRWRLQMIKLRLLVGLIPQPQLLSLWQMAASLAFQLEETMARLGERAALATELALQSEK
jgi:hypothetical protein